MTSLKAEDIPNYPIYYRACVACLQGTRAELELDLKLASRADIQELMGLICQHYPNHDISVRVYLVSADKAQEIDIFDLPPCH